MASGSDRDLRRRFNRDPPPPDDTLARNSSVTPTPPSLPPLRSLGSRARGPMATFAGSGSRSSRYRPADRGASERYRPNFEGRGLNSGLDDTDRNIENTNSQLRALLDYTINPIMQRAAPILPPPLPDYDLAEGNRRAKRRKLNSDRSTSSFRGFRYGKYGQVEPGQLTLEIVSCDGGIYSNEHAYPPENILRDDNSVYCTKGNRCNIVLRHQGTTVFSLSELIIKAPGSKFSCPVREGMVFVAMEADELLTRTAQYQIQYTSGRSRRHGATVVFRNEEDGGSITRVQSRPLRAYSYVADADDNDDDDDDEEDDDDDEDEDDDDDDDDDDEYRTAQIPPEFTAPPPPFNITTECTEDSSDEDDPRPPGRRTPNRIGALPFESDSSDDGIAIWGQPSREWPAINEVSSRRFYPASSRARGSRSGGGGGGAGPSGITLEQAREASQIATQEAVRAVGGELMAPLAHFLIDEDKHKCTIRFDPPVSGRFILLKMWSPHQDPHGGPENIDIQGVIAKGFAGPRFSPCIELA